MNKIIINHKIFHNKTEYHWIYKIYFKMINQDNHFNLYKQIETVNLK